MPLFGGLIATVKCYSRLLKYWAAKNNLNTFTSCGQVFRDFEREAKLGVTFNSDKLGGIDFTKFSKLTMCSA